MEMVTPITDLKVKLPQAIKVSKVTSRMLGEELKIDKKNNAFVLPKLVEYDVLVIE